MLRRHGLLRHPVEVLPAAARRLVEPVGDQRRRRAARARGRLVSDLLRLMRVLLILLMRMGRRAIHLLLLLVRVVRRVLLEVAGEGARHALLRDGSVCRVRLGREREGRVGGPAVGNLAVQAVSAVAADDDAVDDEGDEEEEAAAVRQFSPPECNSSSTRLAAAKKRERETYQLMAPRPEAAARTLANASSASVSPVE